MSSAGILAVPSVREFFEEALRAVLEEEGLQAETATTAYLVDLLCQYVSKPPDFDRPLSIAVTSFDRIRLKQVGDHALYVAGYFRPSLQNSHLDLEYFNTIGEAAYRRLCLLLRRQKQSPTLLQIYTELADDFLQFVELLAGVRSQAETLEAEADIVSLYEQWINGGGEAQRRRLLAAGMVLPPRSEKN